MTEREQIIADKMRRLLEFIRKGERLTEIDVIHSHAHQVVGWSRGLAEQVLRMLGEQP